MEHIFSTALIEDSQGRQAMYKSLMRLLKDSSQLAVHLMTSNDIEELGRSKSETTGGGGGAKHNG